MPTPGHRRQLLLFLAAIILPCLVLVALGVRMIGQERQLLDKRVAEEQRRLKAQIQQQLVARLERISLEAVGAAAAGTTDARSSHYSDPAVVLVGWVDDRRLILPWDNDRAAARFRELLAEPAFARALRRGEDQELLRKQFDRAARLYEEAARGGRDAAQATYARLLEARALAKAGRFADATVLDRRILTSPVDLVDEHGIPLAYYAAARRLDLRDGLPIVLSRLQSDVDATRWLGPPEAYMVRQLAERVATTTSDDALRGAAQRLRPRIDQRIRVVEQALALQNDFANLMLVQGAGSPPGKRQALWFPYGDERWLVSVAPSLAGLRPVVVAVRAADAFAWLDGLNQSRELAGPFQLSADRRFGGELLGESLPGVKVSFAPADSGVITRASNLQRAFYLAALLLVVSGTLFGGYLLWRDVRRELRLAELRSQFVSSVSHELKTPLTAIRMFAETLQLDRTPDDRARGEYLETIVNETERLTRLLNNVLDFSKIERGQKIYHPAPTSLPDVVRAAARAMQYPLEQQGFHLHVDVDEHIPQVSVDRDALEQAILNLLANAMKYSGESRAIGLRLSSLDGEAVIDVIDHGVGIRPDEQERIFEKFYRAQTPDNQLIPGAGLGLALVAHIVTAHRGRVEVKSMPGAGSTFSIRLPLEPSGGATPIQDRVGAGGEARHSRPV